MNPFDLLITIVRFEIKLATNPHFLTVFGALCAVAFVMDVLRFGFVGAIRNLVFGPAIVMADIKKHGLFGAARREIVNTVFGPLLALVFLAASIVGTKPSMKQPEPQVRVAL